VTPPLPSTYRHNPNALSGHSSPDRRGGSFLPLYPVRA
jgi:hypothetical protein